MAPPAAVLSETVLAWMEPAPAAGIVPVPLAVRVTEPVLVLLAITLPFNVMKPLVVGVPVFVIVTDVAAVTAPLVLIPLPEVLRVTVLPDAPLTWSEPAEEKVTAAVVFNPCTLMGLALRAVFTSLMLMSPEVVPAVKSVVLTLRAVVAVPKLPELLLRVSFPAVAVAMVAVPVILPAAVVRVSEPVVLAVLPSVVPLSVMPPEPLVTIMLISVAFANVGEMVTAVADCRLKLLEFEAVRVRAELPKPRFLMLASPVVLAARLAVCTRSAVTGLPMALPLAVLRDTVLA